ncbi:2'-5' RNA ligase family protein [Streptomyces platensis]|nr:2'-5' RNA ligase family protein [Streptomyces platensis]QEV55911.1 2'-5' RNA ligase family protein [Streptomyces platensis]
MADDSTRRFQAGQTGLIVRVPEAEPAVRAWRERFDPSARAGVPAHVTVLFPFLSESRMAPHVCLALAGLLGKHGAFDLRFERCGRFPGVLYLAPEPDAQLRRLTEVIADRWPEAPPYGGKFTGIVPHLTIADGQDDAVLDEVEAELLGQLPFTSRVSSVVLMVHDGAKWRERASFALCELTLGSLAGDLVDGGVVGVEPSPVRGQYFQCAEAMSLLAVDQL